MTFTNWRPQLEVNVKNPSYFKALLLDQDFGGDGAQKYNNCSKLVPITTN